MMWRRAAGGFHRRQGRPGLAASWPISFHTFGELCLSPVGLSNVTKLAPPKFVSRMMGTWFLGTAIGNTIAGLVGGHIRVAQAPASCHISSWIMTLIGGGAGVFIMLLRAAAAQLDWRQQMSSV